MQLDGFLPGCLFYFYTQQHKPSSFPAPVLTILSVPPSPPPPSPAALFAASPFRARSPLPLFPPVTSGPNEPLHDRAYKVIYTRTPQEDTAGSLSTQTAWCRCRCERIPPAGRRPQDCLYHERSTLGPSAGTYDAQERPPTCGKINQPNNMQYFYTIIRELESRTISHLQPEARLSMVFIGGKMRGTFAFLRTLNCSHGGFG
jgi:hypothetical protein